MFVVSGTVVGGDVKLLDEGASIEANADMPSRMMMSVLFGEVKSSCGSSPSSSDGPRLRSEKRSSCLEESKRSARLCGFRKVKDE